MFKLTILIRSQFENWLENKDYKGVYDSKEERKKRIIPPARMIKKKV